MLESHRLDTDQASVAPKEQTTDTTSIPVEQRSTDGDGNTNMLEATNLNLDEADLALEESAAVGTNTICMPVEQTNTDSDGDTNMLLVKSSAANDLNQNGNTVEPGVVDSGSRSPERTNLLTYSANTDENAESTALAIVPLTICHEGPENCAPDTAVDPTSVVRFSTGSQEAAESGPSKITTSGDENLGGVYWRKAPQPLNGISPSILVDEIWKWSLRWKLYNPDSDIPFACMCADQRGPAFLFFYNLKEELRLMDTTWRWWYCQRGEFGEGVAGVFKCVALHELFNSSWPPGTVFACAPPSENPESPAPVLKGSDNHILPGELFFTSNHEEGLEEEL